MSAFMTLARPMAVFVLLVSCGFTPMDQALAQRPGQSSQDQDESAEGQARLGDLAQRAREVYRQRDSVAGQRRPLALQRDPLAIRITKLQGLGKEMVATLMKANRQAQIVNNNLQNAQEDDAFVLRRQLRSLQRDIEGLEFQIRANNDLIDVAVTDLKTIDNQIAPLDKELARLWTDIEEVRGQWDDLREPAEKFARGEYEALFEAVDEWQRADALWPGGYYWKALCAYELGDITEAETHANKAEEIRIKELGMTDPVSESEAVIALVHTKMGGKYGARAKERFSKAVRLYTKQPSWFTNFVIGRCYAEKEADATRAKIEFEKSLKAKPKNLCATVWLARLQTTARKETVRDVEAGTQTLEGVWNETGKRSWRLGAFLVEAYAAADRKTDAEALLKEVLTLTPPGEQTALRERYAKLAPGS